jgi:hypothetical protein
VVLWVWFFGCATSPQVAVRERDERAAGKADASTRRDARPPDLERQQEKRRPAGWGWATRPLEYLDEVARQRVAGNLWAPASLPRVHATVSRASSHRGPGGRYGGRPVPPLPPGSLPDRMGLREGDVVTGTYGEPPSIWGRIGELTVLRDPTVPVGTITFLRGGEPMESAVYLDAIQ